MPPARQKPPQKPLAPFIVAAAILIAVVMTWMRMPGGTALWVGMIAAAYFTVPPLLTGPKDQAGYPTPLGANEAKQLQRHRFWNELKWRLFTPSADWLPNSTRDFPKLRVSQNDAVLAKAGKLGTLSAVVAIVGVLADSARILGWLLIPARFTYIAAVGVALAVFTLPTDKLMPDLVWVNALTVFILLVQLDVTYRRNVDVDDQSPGVRLSVIVARVADGGIPALFPVLGMVLAGIVLGAAAALGVVLTHLAWLIVPVGLFGAGIAVASSALFLHAAGREEALTPWRNTMAARATWKPRWKALKIDPAPYLVSHERVGAAETPVDTFEAPGAMGGAAGAIGMYPKLLPLMGSGVRVALLPTPDVDSDGQPIDGSKHPLRFRVVTWQQDTIPAVADPKVDQEELSLFLESTVYLGVLAAQQYQPTLLGITPIFTAADGDKNATAAWASYWSCNEAAASNSLNAARGEVGNALQSEVYVDNPGGNEIMYVGAVTAETTTLQDPKLTARLEELEIITRWAKRWEDLLKVGARPPVLQYPFRKDAKLDATTVMHSQPFLVKQGLDPFEFFHPQIKKGLATTLKAAPFVTVTGYPAAGYRDGERHPQGFTVIWSEKPVPTSPSNLSPAGDRNATRWALAGSVNDAFDAAKLPGPRSSPPPR